MLNDEVCRVPTDKQTLMSIRWENTADFAHDFSAGIGPLQLGVVLVLTIFQFTGFQNDWDKGAVRLFLLPNV